jgi:transposase-like protein
MVPVLAAVFRRRKHPVGKRWLVNETCIKVAGDVQTSPIPGFRFAQSR